MNLSFLDQVLSRSSVRNFTNTPVELPTLTKLLECAQRAPTSGFMQSWSVLVITDPLLKEKLIQDNYCIGCVDGQNVKMLRSPSPYLIWLADLRRNKILLDKKDISTNDYVSKADFHLKAICDATIAAQTFCLAAESIGIGTCYMGTIREITWSYWNEMFGLGKHVFPLFGTAIGYPDKLNDSAKKFRTRLPQSNVVHYNQYNDVNNVADYNQIYANSKARFASFEEQLRERVGNVGRTKLEISSSLRDAGFTFE